ncbi:Alpha/Beta hydrolase protein, partial [Gautieria morchelliformis]
LQVSFSDLGSSSGRPVVVFLGLGCVRYIMGLYDEMAEALGLRLITIDRWGLGRTDNPSKNTPRGVMEWASVVEEVLDHLKIKRCSIMAHSAGAPYAMAFANRNAERVQGDLCLLAPWVGAGEGGTLSPEDVPSGYKWLKYVPTGIIKTAQAAEWRVQAWMLGKPPTITYTGIGYNLSSPVSCSPMDGNTGTPNLEASPHLKELKEAEPGLNSFSDYDDLADFQGNYASRSTVHINEGDSAVNTPPPVPAIPRNRARSKSNRFFGGLWKSNDVSNPSPTSARGSPRLKALKSMSSLRGSAASRASSRTQQPQTASRASTGGTFESEWTRLPLPASSPSSVSSVQPASEGTRGNARTRRSISLTSSVTSQYSRSAPFQSKGHHLSSPPTNSAFETSAGPNINAALGNALLAASHAESSRGAHADLLQILNLNQKPWGFSYGEFPHAVRVWYGDKDEKIADGAVKWMEKTMRPGTCEIRMIKGAGHGLLYNGGVVVEALEFLKETWYRK